MRIPWLSRGPSQADTVERWCLTAAALVRPDYIAAVAAQIRGDGTAGEKWDEYQRRLTQAFVLLWLLGSTAVARTVCRRGLAARIVRPSPNPLASFAGIDLSSGIFDIPFIEALDVFRKDIPSLDPLMPEIFRVATEVARGSRNEEQSRAALELGKHIRARLIEDDRVAEPEEVAQAIESAAGLSLATARLNTTYRTTLLGAFNAGSFQQLRRNRATFPAYLLSEIKDRRTRGNPAGLYPDAGPHFQMDGFIAAADDPAWGLILPPNGWNCRATVIGLTIADLQRRGYWKDGKLDAQKLASDMAVRRNYIDSGQYPDEGFRGNKALTLGLAA